MDENTPLFEKSSNSYEGRIQSPDQSTVSYHHVEFTVKQRRLEIFPCRCPRVITGFKQVLRGVSGIMKPGMNAIMGPTGAGKSTLLDVLAKRRVPTSQDSRVLLNGHPLPANYNLMSGYVTQDDKMMGTLTVRESLHFSASLRLPSSQSRTDRERLVTKMLHDLGLDKVADSKVGSQQDVEVGRGVSGGERKRTQIGMELVPSPNVLYLDEPTSGLDAFTAASVMQLLKTLGEEGKTVIFSIHQPRFSIFKSFDTVTLLGGGETIYHGPASAAKQYFETVGCICEEHENPADKFLDFIQYRAGHITFEEESLAQKFRNSSSARDIESELQGIGMSEERYLANSVPVTYPSSFATQLLVISKRTLRNFTRLPTAMRAQIVLNLFMALVVGLVFLQLNEDPRSAIQNRTGAIFLIIMITMFTNMPAVEMFVKQRALFMHESASGYYRVSSYFLARVLCDMVPLRIIPVLFASLVAYWLIGFTHSASNFFFFVFDLLLTSLSSCSLAFLYSSIAKELVLAMLLLATTFLVMVIFGGLLINLASPPAFLQWIKWISIFRYSMEALCINELQDKEYCLKEFAINGTCPQGNLTASGNDYLKDQGFHVSDKWITQIALAAIFVGVLALTYIRLRLMSKVK